MIKIGENPERAKGVNKFLAGNEGFRGKLLALHENGRKAIILAQNTALDGETVVWGRLYLVEETDPNEYPRVLAPVDSIPTDKDWCIVEDQP